MKKLRKTGAIILAVMMLAVCVSASADPETLTGGKAGEAYTSANEGQKVDNSVTFPKQIVIFNTADSTTVYNPNITYTYTVTPATVTSITVKDGDNDQGTVYAGVSAALATSDPAYDLSAVFSSDATTTAGTKGAVASDNITIVFNPDGFGHAGIFRYVITEADSSAARTAAGVARKGTDTARYLDVYVRVDSTDADGDNSSTDYVIYGYVLSTANDSKNEQNAPANPDADAGLTTKTGGFLADYNNETGVVTTGDYYNTYNLKVVKNVAGTLGDRNEAFPFGIAFSNTAITSQPKVGVDPDHDHQSGTFSATVATFAEDGTLSIGDGTSADSVLKLKHDDYILITGIPAEVTSTVTERNSSYDIYTADITTTAITGGTARHTTVKLQPAGTTSVTEVTGTNGADDNALTAGDLVLTVTNTMDIVSPTGLVLRFAPYALILLGGIALLVIAMKRKGHREEE